MGVVIDDGFTAPMFDLVPDGICCCVAAVDVCCCC